ncbi:hypothetical protein ACFL56_02615 [Candidatus Margulisiibacteriota bacterium]
MKIIKQKSLLDESKVGYSDELKNIHRKIINERLQELQSGKFKGITWTSKKTFNDFIHGCLGKKSPGCLNCWAHSTVENRFVPNPKAPYKDMNLTVDRSRKLKPSKRRKPVMRFFSMGELGDFQ